MKGYKVFNPDFTCLEFQFEEGKEYKTKGKLELCKNGFHFCEVASDCFNYYSFNSNNIVCEVEALGDVVTQNGENKLCTNHIKIIKRLTWLEVLNIVNLGKDNTGLLNTGNRNTGYSNTGNRNTGYSNTGNRNTGDWNTGNRNTGYSNTGDWNTGGFCTGEKTIKLFNKESDWTHEKFKNSNVFSLLCQIDTKMWVYENSMTNEEKEKYPSYKTSGGYLKDIPYKEAFQNKWHNWSEENKQEFKNLPNFDAEIFEEITGVKV
jgi:hypothetical protein